MWRHDCLFWQDQRGEHQEQLCVDLRASRWYDDFPDAILSFKSKKTSAFMLLDRNIDYIAVEFSFPSSSSHEVSHNCCAVVFLGFDFYEMSMRKSKPKENTAQTDRHLLCSLRWMLLIYKWSHIYLCSRKITLSVLHS